MWGREGPAISSDGTMYTGTGDGKWDPENGIYGNGIVGVKLNPETKALELVGLLRAVKCGMAGQARFGYAGYAGDFQLQGQGTDGGRGQGVPCLFVRYEIDWRR